VTPRAALVCLVWLGLSSSGRAAADGFSDAEANARAVSHYQLGVIEYDNGNYRGALLEFTQAHELSKRPQLLYNVGLCEKHLGLFKEAVEHFRAFLAAHPDVSDRSKVEQAIAEIEQLEQQRTRLEEDRAPPPSWARRNVGGLVTTSLGVVVLGGMLATGLGADHDLSDAGCVAATKTCADLDKEDHAHNLAIASDVLLGIGVAAVATGAILFIVEAKRHPRVAKTAGVTILGFRVTN